MKIRTNLTSKELVLVSKGLNKLAIMEQKDGKFKPSNAAEKDLLALTGSCLDEMLESLTSEIKELFDE